MAGNKFFRLQRIKQQLKRFLALPLAFVALFLFVFVARSQNSYVIETRRALYDSFTPMMRYIVSPIDMAVEKISFLKNYLFVFEENERLRAENEALKGWQHLAFKLAREQKELFEHLKYEPSFETPMKLVRVLGEYNGPFTHSVVLEGGTKTGIHKGDVLMQHNAVFGHVIEVNMNTSRALKLTDYFSRLPVLVGENRTPAIMMGNNTKMPELIALPEEHSIQAGDRVVSAGVAGVYLDGLMIGTVAKEGDTFQVDLTAKELQNSFIQVVHFDMGGLIDTMPAMTQEGR